ncbi:MAG: hypothetical protein QM802_16905 [Agriterribacter sp.]
MKAYKILYSVLAVTMLYACAKKLDEITPAGNNNPSTTNPADSTETVPSVVGCGPDYGDSVLCYQLLASGQDYKMSPLKSLGKGRYVAEPDGLVIDNNTGEINVTKSESGLAYKVGFIADGSTDTCFTKIITSGINYLDGIHVISDNDTLAVPVYNGSITPVCGSGGLFSGCEFDDDDDDDNGNGSADEPPAGQSCNSKNIRVDTKNGVISLKRSLLDGIFGSLTPNNGKTVNATLYYRLDDCSNKALRKIDLSFTYYDKMSNVPQSLIDDISNSVKNILGLLMRTDGDKAAANPRPPHIVVVANR